MRQNSVNFGAASLLMVKLSGLNPIVLKTILSINFELDDFVLRYNEKTHREINFYMNNYLIGYPDINIFHKKINIYTAFKKMITNFRDNKIYEIDEYSHTVSYQPPIYPYIKLNYNKQILQIQKYIFMINTSIIRILLYLFQYYNSIIYKNIIIFQIHLSNIYSYTESNFPIIVVIENTFPYANIYYFEDYDYPKIIRNSSTLKNFTSMKNIIKKYGNCRISDI